MLNVWTNVAFFFFSFPLSKTLKKCLMGFSKQRNTKTYTILDKAGHFGSTGCYPVDKDALTCPYVVIKNGFDIKTTMLYILLQISNRK